MLVANAWARTASAQEKADLITQLSAFNNNTAEQIIAALKTAPVKEGKTETIEDLAKTHQILKLATVPGVMKYDQPSLTARAGQPLAIEFSNPDAMQHNLVAAKPGSFDTVAAGALKMMTDPEGMARNSGPPELPEIIAGTRHARSETESDSETAGASSPATICSSAPFRGIRRPCAAC